MQNKRPSDFYLQQKEKSRRFAWLSDVLVRSLQNPNFGHGVMATSGIPTQEIDSQPRRSERLAAKKRVSYKK